MKQCILPVAILVVAATLFFGESSFAQCCGGGKAKDNACLNKTQTSELESTTPQTKCPVMGGNINKEVFVDYKGKRIYFCCNACIERFNEEPEKYMKKLKEDGAKLKDAPKKT